jgi:DNA-binding NarL/FixJ family response regulator
MEEHMPRSFTASEQKIARAILTGHTNWREIRRITGYSQRWVSVCLASMYRKTGAKDRTQLVLVMTGLLPLRPQGGEYGATSSHLY